MVYSIYQGWVTPRNKQRMKCDCLDRFNWYKDPGPSGKHHEGCATLGKVKTCSECGEAKPHRRIDKEYNRVTGPARKWAAICVDCSAKPVDRSEYMTKEEIAKADAKANAYNAKVLGDFFSKL